MFGNLFAQKKPDEGSLPVVDTVQSNASSPIQPSVMPSPSPVTAPVEVKETTLDPSRKQDVSTLSHLDARSSQALTHAQEEATRLKLAKIEPEMLFYGLLFDQEIFNLLQKFSVDVSKLSKEIQAKQVPGNAGTSPMLSDGTKNVFEVAYKSAKERNVAFISPEDLLVALFAIPTVGGTLEAQGVTKEKLVEKLTSSSSSYHAGKKSILQEYGVDLTQMAKDGKIDPIAGRDTEIERVVHILLRRLKNNPIIIGEAGVGKTAIVEGLAMLIAQGKAPKDLSNKRIIQLDLASLVAGASHRGEFEERLREVIKEATESSGQVMLFIDEIHTLIGTGDTDGALDASNIIKPYLARGQMQIIGTTTTAEYRKYFEKDKAFARRFQPVIADEPTEEKALLMLQALKGKYEKFHSVTLSDDTLKQAVHLSKKYIGERFLPDKAVDLLDEAAADVKLQHTEGKREDIAVVKSDIEKVVSNWTGIPITRLTEDEGEKLLHLAELIHKRLIGQEEAVESVTEAVQRGRIGLASANRPIASFVFLGPTGVGKTELAKTLAEILFGKDDLMIRLDMSEYMEKHEVAKLIGAPPGYVGYEEGGQLTEAVRLKPYSIVLLDEVEKAHPDVFNILLQLLEDGRLTDNKGNTVSFKNTIVIATSNIGSSLIQQQLSKPHATAEEYQKDFADLQTLLSDELHKFFKPELLNRFDEVVVFKPLQPADMASIAKNNMSSTEKLLKEQGYGMSVTQTAIMELAKEGYDPIYGARPLRRLIQTAIENPIAIKIISKVFIQPDTILIDYDAAKTEFTFAKGAAMTEDKKETDGSTPESSEKVNEEQKKEEIVSTPLSSTMGTTQNPVMPQVPPVEPSSIPTVSQPAPWMPPVTPQNLVGVVSQPNPVEIPNNTVPAAPSSDGASSMGSAIPIPPATPTQ